MDKFLSYLLLLPLIVWGTFQPILFMNASQVEETLRIATYEGQKEAALQGRYDETIYKMIRDYLVENHNYKSDQIQITGTESLTSRGERMVVEISIPHPKTTVIPFFPTGDDQPMVIKRYIMSEHLG
ncbi:hypothetical protein AB3N04_00830 (plasmid) [Alkalihalophilus sp. As8PL]|uniref:ComG operon protein 7 n=1 Tax=Alkalihalophilus sp. As8PL TaxID=3237103 RepID=A0AB39BMY8_9BACI